MSETAAEKSNGASTSTSASHLPANHTNAKPVVLRVKRKASLSRPDAFWLEINGRPMKRPLLDITSLSVSEPLVGDVVEKNGTKKLLVQHLETVGRAEDIKDVLCSFLHDSSCSHLKRKAEERPNLLKHDKISRNLSFNNIEIMCGSSCFVQKKEKSHSMARKEHEDFARNARFEQIWKRRRKGGDADEDSLLEICHLYDVVQFDSENETNVKTSKPKASPLDDNAILCNYLPLIREYIPSAAVDIESDIARSGEEDYLYDLYTVDDDLSVKVEETNAYPLILLDDDDNYDGTVESDYDTDDSNAEDNPLNDYPDEESSEDGDGRDLLDESEGSDSQYENEEVDVDEEDAQDWKWGYR